MAARYIVATMVAVFVVDSQMGLLRSVHSRTLNVSSKYDQYLASSMSGADFTHTCSQSNQVYIEPVYYMPGDRVKLACKVCQRSLAYNGLSKQWATLRYVKENVANLKTSLSKWTLLETNEVSHDANDLSMLNLPYLDQSKLYDGSTQAKPQQPSNLRDRPKTQFFHKNGNLIIVHAHMDTFALYRCFDHESENVINHVYLLIPIVPLLFMENMNGFRYECKFADAAAHDNALSQFDEYHRFHFLPSVLFPDNRTCSAFASTPADCIRFSSFNIDSQGTDDPVAHLQNDDMKADSVLLSMANLRIFVRWTNWSTCHQGEAVRTRKGHCYLGLIDASKKFDTSDLPFNFPTLVKNIHIYMSSVNEFRQIGIPLYSAVVLDSIMNDNNPNVRNHCTKFSGSELSGFEMIIESLLAVVQHFKPADGQPQHDILDSYCLRSSERPAKFGYGHMIIQNEPCSD